MHAYNEVLTVFGFSSFFVFCVFVKVKLSVSLLQRLELPLHYYIFVCILPEKADPEMPHIVSSGKLNSTHLLTYFLNTFESFLCYLVRIY